MKKIRYIMLALAIGMVVPVATAAMSTPALAASNPGSINTTDSTETVVNGNHYVAKQAVYLRNHGLPPVTSLADPVKTETGYVTGALIGPDNDIHIFRGIPYAAPPVGDLRWRPPQPAAPFPSRFPWS
jgi:hypothetical protein